MSMAGPIAAFTGIFSAVVLVHETGHYTAARWCVVPVAEFCIGFPGTPVLYTFWRHRGTSFTVRLLPFGGFVRFGDDWSTGCAKDTGEDSESAGPDREESITASEEGTSAFECLPPCKKAIILVAGSLVNLVAGACLMVAAIMAIKGLGFLNAATAIVELMGMVFSETFSALLHCNVSGVVGPVGAAGITRDVLSKGVWPLVGFVGLMNFSVGIMNLLPVPGFDGWHVMLAAIEAARGKPLSGRFQALAGATGFAVIVALMVVVTYRDIVRTFGEHPQYPKSIRTKSEQHQGSIRVTSASHRKQLTHTRITS
jgi:membrane-associated protease RseP (regulator of RpoE activity)